MHPTEETAAMAVRRGPDAVERRVYATLLGRASASVNDARLCAKLASLAGRLYGERALDDADLDEMLAHVARD